MNPNKHIFTSSYHFKWLTSKLTQNELNAKINRRWKQPKDHSVHNFHEVLKNFSATLTSRKKSAQNRFEDAFQMFRTLFSFLEIIMAKTCCKLKICCHHHNGKIEQSKQIIERLRDFWRKIDLLGIFTPKLQIWNFENWHFWLGFAITWFQTFRN